MSQVYKCAVGCGISSPPIGIANIQGKKGSVVEGVQGQYPLCAYHYESALNGSWVNIDLLGWEPFPDVDGVQFDFTLTFSDECRGVNQHGACTMPHCECSCHREGRSQPLHQFEEASPFKLCKAPCPEEEDLRCDLKAGHAEDGSDHQAHAQDGACLARWAGERGSLALRGE